MSLFLEKRVETKYELNYETILMILMENPFSNQTVNIVYHDRQYMVLQKERRNMG